MGNLPAYSTTHFSPRAPGSHPPASPERQRPHAARVCRRVPSRVATGLCRSDFQPWEKWLNLEPPHVLGREPLPFCVGEAISRFSTEIANPSVSATDGASGTVTISPALLQAGSGPQLFAKVTIALPPLAHADKFRLLVNAPAGAAGAGLASPHNTGVVAIFGYHIMPAPVTFTVPLSGSLTALRASNLLPADTPRNIRVVSEVSAMPPTARAHAMSTPAEVVSIVVEAH
jgi:hypothetical protein